MSDRQHRTIDFLDDQIGRDQARWTALLAALDALVWDQIETENIAWCRVCEAEWELDQSVDHAADCPIGRLAAILATHRESQSASALCPDCDHGIAGGQPCRTCGGSGYLEPEDPRMKNPLTGRG